ncbi:hypothetical protein KFL_004190106 [Klebsormidium nitens]|uniref:Uncharacterized protein n=1 Tax=Klebsormidium nitens TaxID=105231 RepID=A0A1Y1IBP7_KLENI|nr:hypothetical protein KFL_004190106 [Klebsormidium nitens]|eukprot:GAQ88340.1 hypothetical protein KFL_004190106 [Klebsormidium nitens]
MITGPHFVGHVAAELSHPLVWRGPGATICLKYSVSAPPGYTAEPLRAGSAAKPTMTLTGDGGRWSEVLRLGKQEVPVADCPPRALLLADVTQVSTDVKQRVSRTRLPPAWCQTFFWRPSAWALRKRSTSRLYPLEEVPGRTLEGPAELSIRRKYIPSCPPTGRTRVTCASDDVSGCPRTLTLPEPNKRPSSLAVPRGWDWSGFQGCGRPAEGVLAKMAGFKAILP